jgi:putative transposase
VSRASLYYKPRPATDSEIVIKHRLDALYTEYPFLGSRKIARILEEEGLRIGRHAIRHYRQEMGLETLFPKPKLSQPGGGPEHRVYPYLLRGLSIERPNQVWGVDITYIRLVGGWMYRESGRFGEIW